jgi:enolase-phosphatase E1
MKGYFDTNTGPKREPSSYTAITTAFELAPSDILFISDVVRELDAAAAAGLQILLSLRPGNHPQPPNAYPSVSSFADVAKE